MGRASFLVEAPDKESLAGKIKEKVLEGKNQGLVLENNPEPEQEGDLWQAIVQLHS